MRNDKLIAYYRVSTFRQGKSGLGLEAQRHDVEAYAAMTGQIVSAEYTEVESGGNSKRPELQLAIKRCQLIRGTLVIAKLDRLSRSVGFIAQLQDSGVPFTACDMPEANETIDVCDGAGRAKSNLSSYQGCATGSKGKRSEAG
ncbi:recombinase family protein [uncultured Neptuniibacter sp.]|uniref:recombinase family protein n=1 Tax=uncultured Neptuniibacter sp. TaxID=502143 RepID=UPI002613DBBC|nr:recombinase family protein [uncultured Neptuniibacter sp.]